LLGLFGGLIILGTSLIFGVLIDTFYPPELWVLLGAALVLLIVAQRQGVWDFGNAYETAIFLMGALLAVLLVYALLTNARANLFAAQPVLRLLGEFLLWIGAAFCAGAAILLWQRRRTS
jgi:hypothetical protein